MADNRKYYYLKLKRKTDLGRFRQKIGAVETL